MARQNFIGLVVSQGKMNKTVKVRVQSVTYDKRIHKEVLKRKDYLVHDEGNLCKEGDVVRIEAIPKITERKYFAIAEIKVNKGQKFAAYEEMAKKRVAEEESRKLEEFFARRTEFEKTIDQIEDLKELDRLSKFYQRSEKETDEERQEMLQKINEIKKKYNITSWPTTQQIVPVEVTEAAKDLSIIDNRLANINRILKKLLSKEYDEERKRILAAIGRSEEGTPQYTIKNILRKFVLNPKNEVHVSL